MHEPARLKAGDLFVRRLSSDRYRLFRVSADVRQAEPIADYPTRHEAVLAACEVMGSKGVQLFETAGEPAVFVVADCDKEEV